MKHATIKLDGVEIPLIGLPEDCTIETCELCGRRFHLSAITLTPAGQFLCVKCKGDS